ncbi:MAG: thiamine phosphate synthase [Prevotella sp.]|nr:thiamine phosphate synthase [Prevotella sp.]MCM1075495.1 thiamine phosphate synthase [Ruminococcus sp.]
MGGEQYWQRWTTIVITSPKSVPDEAAKITRLLESGAADWVHIRKPEWELSRIGELIEQIPKELHPRLKLHSGPELLEQFECIGGLHLNSRMPDVPVKGKALSRSCHTIEELAKADSFQYVTLSPIFDSISKPGYGTAFNLDELRDVLTANRNVIALGGVTPQRFRVLAKVGFAGAALLGYVWNDFESAILQLIKHKALINNFPLQFITNTRGAVLPLMCERVLEAGCKWVQVRIKGADSPELQRAIELIRPESEAHGATLIVDDNVEIAARLGVGVHLGRNDMPAPQAREILGPEAIIGCTCNTADDIARVIAEGAADYIGLGPFRFTTTKQNLAPVLGLEGYREILTRPELTALPIVGIGGITLPDIEPLMGVGLDGIAVSGMISNAPNPAEATTQIITEINTYI